MGIEGGERDGILIALFGFGRVIIFLMVQDQVQVPRLGYRRSLIASAFWSLNRYLPVLAFLGPGLNVTITSAGCH